MASPAMSRLPLVPTHDFDEDADTSDYASDVSSEDDGVFLGPRKSIELDIVSKLSHSSTPSPQILRARKKDSREFLRRKTLMLTVQEKEERLPRRTSLRLGMEPRSNSNVNGEPSDSDEEDSPPLALPETTTPSKSQMHSDLSFQLAAFHLSTPLSQSQTHTRSQSSSTSESDDAGSDKENTPMPQTLLSSHEATLAEVIVSIGQDIHSAEESDDEIGQLDMGGLKLSDFEDPDLGIGSMASPVATPLDQHSDSETSSSGDSPLPVSRAGPVVIPVLSHHFASIRADPSSPCRAFHPSPVSLPPMAVFEAEQAMVLNPIRDSPQAAEPQVAATPSRITALPPLDLVERGKKLLKASTLHKPMPRPDKSGQRALAIRGQLDSVLSARTSALGPPQRSVSASSSISTASSSSKASTSKSSTTILASSKTAPLSNAKPLSSSLTSKSEMTMPRAKPRPVVTKPIAAKIRAEAKKPEIRMIASSRPPLRPTALTQPTAPRPKAIPVASSIPVKRPLAPSVVPTTRPALVMATGSRPALGQPSRFREGHHAPPVMAPPLFSVGIDDGPELGRLNFRSPARPGMIKRSFVGGTPTPRKTLGTPSRFGTPRRLPAPTIIPIHFANEASSTSAPASLPTPAQDVTAVQESVTSGPPASATRQASEHHQHHGSPPPLRGSSEDREEVSVQLEKAPSTSPTHSPQSTSGKTRGTKPRRGRPPASATPAPEAKCRKTAADISEKEIKTATQRNTMRNQVYHCAIDRQIIRKNEPRPPSPTSKIRTTADRDEEAKKASRSARAKRRTGEDSPERPVIERLVREKEPGDEEPYVHVTPTRPTKRARTEEKSVKWDRGLTIIRDDGSVRPPTKDGSDNGEEKESNLKSCLRTNLDLDHLGNVRDWAKPIENLKRVRIVVTAVFYEGEEPVPPTPAPSTATRSRKK